MKLVPIPVTGLFWRCWFRRRPGGAAKPIPNPPELNASSYFLIDFDSGRVLAEKTRRARVEPASITKLMTAYLVDKAIADGDIGSDPIWSRSARKPGV